MKKDTYIEVVYFQGDDLRRTTTVRFYKSRVEEKFNAQLRAKEPTHVWEGIDTKEFVSHVTSYIMSASERNFIPIDEDYENGGVLLSSDSVMRIRIGRPVEEEVEEVEEEGGDNNV